ncbi:DUF4406 domain-containing protein [Actinomyces faecalis]|uniref:DUF7768 domain-containing protein n=1 Tax=Actinomyces faecalis TaxID=2722820 RepID=UPI00155364DF|nr:DUF4406 domain-containing protein [Actinomyces faecalis]
MNPTDSAIPRLNASGCADPTVFEVLKREQRAQFGYWALAYICSPFSGYTEANIRLARRMCAAAVARRRIPIAPHLLFPQFMNDHDPTERELAMFMGRIVLSKCEEMWVYAPRISPGMRTEACWARHLDIPLRFLDSNFREIKP